MDRWRLDGKFALVTGASGGLGALLASDLSAYMTGSVIDVDGGHLVSTL